MRLPHMCVSNEFCEIKQSNIFYRIMPLRITLLQILLYILQYNQSIYSAIMREFCKSRALMFQYIVWHEIIAWNFATTFQKLFSFFEILWNIKFTLMYVCSVHKLLNVAELNSPHPKRSIFRCVEKMK